MIEKKDISKNEVLPEEAKTSSEEIATEPRRLGALVSLVIIALAIAAVAGTSHKWKDNDATEDDGSRPPNTNTFTATTGPFAVSLPFFGTKLVTTPDSPEEREAVFESGVANASWFLLNNMINTHARAANGSLSSSPGTGDYFNEDALGDSILDTSVDEDLSDYGTNNQEEGVEEGDTIVSDGKLGEKECLAQSAYATRN